MTGVKPHTPELYQAKSRKQWNYRACVSSSISLQFSQGKLRPEGRGMSQCTNSRRGDADPG